MSFNGYKYFVTFIDDYLRYTCLSLLETKNKVATVFQGFCNLVKTQFVSTIKTVQSNNDTEYMSHIMT
jgi:hypothetical protein